MSNWIVKCSQMYFTPFVERMKQELLSPHVTQSDETPTQVIADSDHPNSKCYMWVHRSGEFYTRRPIVVYEYQKGRDHQKPLDFYKDYKGVLVTDSLQQYHLVDKKLPDVTNANCWAHARRDFADAVKAADKKDPLSVRQSVAYQALQKIAEFYNADTELKGLSSRERLQKRQEVIKPMVEEFFAWVKQQVSDCTVPPKSKTGQGLNFVINQEKYLQIFLEDGNVPIDNSASERAIRTFCLGKKNWMFHNTAKGASASAMVYSISETAKLNEGKNKVYLIILIRISQFQCVMITSRHIPVQSAQNTLIVINQCLTPQLGKKAVSEIKFCPCFVQDKTPVLVDLRILSPNSDVLCRHLDFQVRPLVVN